jgi:peptidyl-tRNA hydrolase, PTH1 family
LPIKLVVGLGNDDRKYSLTPHNVGFQAVDLLAGRLGWDAGEKKEYAVYRGESVWLVKPHSLMNVSGPKVAAAARDAGAGPEELLVVCDDFAIPWGRLRFRRKGSSGGHNGLESVIQALGTQEFPRLRVGVGPVPEGADPADYVLRPLSKARMEELAAKAADGLRAALEQGLDPAMNKFNAAEEGAPSP